MNPNKLLEIIIVLSLLIATLGTGYVFIVTIIYKKKTFSGFYSSWQFPMLIALLIDSTYYEHINSL